MISNHSRTSNLISVAAFFIMTVTSQVARGDDVSTSFENLGAGDFTIGTSPITATFTVGNAQTVGVIANYRTGFWSWHVAQGTTGLITFETPASVVSLFIRDDFRAAGSGEVRAIDTAGATIETQAVTSAFVEFSVTRGQGETLIASVEYENTGAADLVMDDFSFTADVAPGGPLDDPIPEAIPLGTQEVDLQPLQLTGLTAPVWATNVPNDTTTLYVVDQQGQIIAVDLATGGQSTYLDVSALLVPIGAQDERGLLGLAFGPNFAADGLLYTYTSEPLAGAADFSTVAPGTADHQSVITEWTDPDMLDPTLSVDPASARELLRVDQPQSNHNAGALAFGNDDLLYIAFGDGGGADDEGTGHGATGNGQDPTNPLGAILRIDPAGNDSANGNYGIPSGNPFVGMAGMVEEIFAYGFRNPFRMSFDSVTGDLWVGDVGQNDIEEVDVVTAGGNYGWNLKEGSFFFDGNGAGDGFVTADDPGGLPAVEDPVAEYDHDEGIAVIGGFVYGGTAHPGLVGRYVFGDFLQPSTGGGRLFYLDAANAIQEFNIVGQTGFGENLSGFGQDGSGEIYALSNTSGSVYLMAPSPGQVAFDAATASVDEGAGNLTVTVERTGGSGGAASVEYVTADGTATDGSDYTATNGTLNWLDAETGPKTFDVAITDDADVDPNESFTVTLSNETGAALGATATQTITINDNEPPPPPPDPPRRSGGGSFAWFSLLLLGAAGLRRRSRMPR